MTVDYLIKILKDCEYIKGYEMGIGFLSNKVNSVSVVPDGNEEIIKRYSDGAKIKGYDFSLILRLDAAIGDNSKNFSLLSNLCDWLSIRELDDFPKLTDGMPLGISIIQGATLYEDNIHSLKYRIKCRFKYLQEKESY